jgi:hypothetical protein
MEYKVFFFVKIAMLSSSADFLLTVVQGNLATVLVKSVYDLSEDFPDAVNHVCI